MKKIAKIKKRYITLIETMIVMVLIMTIIGVLGYNYQGSIDKGKNFKSKAGIAKLDSIIMLHLAENPDGDIRDWEKWVDASPYAKNPKEMKKDGWGKEYIVELDNKNRVVITDSKGNTNL